MAGGMFERRFDEEVVLDRATEAFRRNGYTGTSIGHLVEATSLGRGSLYGTFGNKEQLFLRVLDRYCRHQIATLTIRTELAPVAALRRYQTDLLDTLHGWGHPGGCLLTNTCAEFGNLPPAAQHRARMGLTELNDQLTDYLVLPVQRGELPSDTRIDEIALHFVASRQSLSLLWRAGNSRSSLECIIELSLSVLHDPPRGDVPPTADLVVELAR